MYECLCLHVLVFSFVDLILCVYDICNIFSLHVVFG